MADCKWCEEEMGKCYECTRMYCPEGCHDCACDDNLYEESSDR